MKKRMIGIKIPLKNIEKSKGVSERPNNPKLVIPKSQTKNNETKTKPPIEDMPVRGRKEKVSLIQSFFIKEEKNPKDKS